MMLENSKVIVDLGSCSKCMACANECRYYIFDSGDICFHEDMNEFPVSGQLYDKSGWALEDVNLHLRHDALINPYFSSNESSTSIFSGCL